MAMEYISQYLLGQSNHSVVNVTNVYNFLISVFDTLNDEQRTIFTNNLKLHVGLSFSDGLKTYIFRKNSKHPILDYL